MKCIKCNLQFNKRIFSRFFVIAIRTEYASTRKQTELSFHRNLCEILSNTRHTMHFTSHVYLFLIKKVTSKLHLQTLFQYDIS